MKKTAFILCLLLASLHVRADLVSEATVDSGDRTQDITIKNKGGKYLVDIAGKITSITDLSAGNTVILYRYDKTFKKMTLDEMNAKRKAGLQGDGPAPTAPPKIVDTGKSEKVGDYNAEIYTAETPAAKFTFWLSKDVPDFAAVNEEAKKYRALESTVYGATNLYPDFSKTDGIFVKFSVAFAKSGKTITTTVHFVKVQAVDDSEFQVPADYTPHLAVPPASTPTPAPAQ